MAPPLPAGENINAGFERGHEYHRATQIHDRFGGQRQGGISTPQNSPFIFIFTGERGDQYGYRDDWNPDGTFSYTGEGQIGDMTFRAGNRAILEHAQNGRDLLLFEKTRRRGFYRFTGTFACAGWDHRAAPDRNGDSRQAIVFRLAPLNLTDIELAPDVDVSAPPDSPLKPFEELRQSAYSAGETPPSHGNGGVRTFYERDAVVRAYVLRRANGICESCTQPAPFTRKSDGTPYLEPHHIRRVSDGGPDHPRWVAGICPSCHREIHFGANGRAKNDELQARIARLEESFDKPS